MIHNDNARIYHEYAITDLKEKAGRRHKRPVAGYRRRNHDNKRSIPGDSRSKVVMLSSYPPRECGIATFTKDLRHAIDNVFGDSIDIRICALENTAIHRRYPEEVDYILNTGVPSDYEELSGRINKDEQVKAVIVQHEFGLFEKRCNADFVMMLHDIRKPKILVFHTVLPHPAATFREFVRGMVKAVDKIVVMTVNAAELLAAAYDIPKEKIVVIPHGTHLTAPQDKGMLRNKYGVSGKIVLSTFGLLSRNKGLKTTLKALPAVIKQHPEVVFYILGRTHPNVVRHEGEAYREELQEMVRELDLENHVRFVNHYLGLDELLEYLQLTDIYLFTSVDPAQAVSGTFSYAMAAGCAVVSTPIPQARELLANGAGLLFDFEDHEGLARQVMRFLDDEQLRKDAAAKAMQLMTACSWENVAIKYGRLTSQLIDSGLSLQYKIPELKLTHLRRLTDSKGIIQFAHGNLPDALSGYTLDDNARALIVAVEAYRHDQQQATLELVDKYLSFIAACQLPDGSFVNFINPDGSFSERNQYINTDDAFGRAIWASGYAVANKGILPKNLGDRANMIFHRALKCIEPLKSPRAMAFALKGLSCYYSVLPSYTVLWTITELADKLCGLFTYASDRKWKWFEPYLTYANSILPESLLLAYKVSQKERYRDIAIVSFDFLLAQTFVGDQIKVISNKGWMQKHQVPHPYGEQPIDVAYTIAALDTFYEVLHEERYRKMLIHAFGWFLGDNHLHQIMYNPVTGGCYDGLEENEVNLNQGAESTICFLMARQIAGKYMNRLSSRYAENPGKPIYSENEKKGGDI